MQRNGCILARALVDAAIERLRAIVEGGPGA
jgi:hypothetical protein